MMAQAQQRTQLQTRLIIARAGERSVCVCVPAREAANTKSTEANACIGIFIQAASHSVQTHIHMQSCVCVREREGAQSLSLCVRCALHLTLALIPFSTL